MLRHKLIFVKVFILGLTVHAFTGLAISVTTVHLTIVYFTL